MSLADAIAEALANADPPPESEADTCHQIIYPLLRASGYAPKEIKSQGVDNNHYFPDYTLLPNDPQFTWYLEAKKWGHPLDEKSAQQAATYAFQNGKRWAVLSNGRIWRLYDSTIQGLAADRLVTEVKLDEVDAFEKFLKAIGKESVCRGELERFAATSRLSAILDKQLRKADGEIIKAIGSALKNKFGVWGVQNADIASYFQEKFASSPAPVVAVPPTIGKHRSEKSHARRRDFGRLERGMRTPEEAYYKPILQALEELGGSAPVRQVLERVRHLMRDLLTSHDFEPLTTHPNVERWNNSAQWARNTMVREGLLRRDSPRGIWAISDAGRQTLRQR